MDNREKNFISAVVYVHDCQDRIGVFLKNVLSALSANFAHSELICVNDYSRDAMQGYDIVSAAPEKRQSLSSRIFYRTFQRYSPMPYKMHTESFRMISRRAINRISGINRAVPYRKAIYASCGLRSDGIYYTPKAVRNASGVTRGERGYRRRLAVDTLLLFTDVGYRLSMFMTALMMLATVFMAVYSLVIFIIGNPVEGRSFLCTPGCARRNSLPTARRRRTCSLYCRPRTTLPASRRKSSC